MSASLSDFITPSLKEVFNGGAKQRFCFRESMSVLNQNGIIQALGFLARWRLTSHSLYYKIPYLLMRGFKGLEPTSNFTLLLDLIVKTVWTFAVSSTAIIAPDSKIHLQFDKKLIL